MLIYMIIVSMNVCLMMNSCWHRRGAQACMSRACTPRLRSRALEGDAQGEPPAAPETSAAPDDVSAAAGAASPVIYAAARPPLPAGSAPPAPLHTRSPVSVSAPVSLPCSTSPPRHYASAVVAPGGPFLRLTDSSGRLVAPDRPLSVSGSSQSYILLPVVTLGAGPTQARGPPPPDAAVASDAPLGPVVTFSEYGSSALSTRVTQQQSHPLTIGLATAVLPAASPSPDANEGAHVHHGLASLSVARRISGIGMGGKWRPAAGAPGRLAFGAGGTATPHHMSATAAVSDPAAIQVLFRTTC